MIRGSRQPHVGVESRPALGPIIVGVEEEHRPPTDELLANDLWRQQELAQRPEPIDPEVLEARIVAQRQRCRDAGEEWERTRVEAGSYELARDVYARQAELAQQRCNVAQGGHQAALNGLWALEARRG